MLSLAIAGCGVGNDKSREDAVDVHHLCTSQADQSTCVDKSGAKVIAFNNHYPNIETKCDGFGHRIFVSTHDSSTGRNTIIVPDPSCPGYIKGQEPTITAQGG